MPERLNIAGKLGKTAMQSRLTPVSIIIVFIIGLVALFITPREENPQIDVPAANVIVNFPGADSKEVLNLVVRPLESILMEITGVDHTYGMAVESSAIVTVQFKVGQNKEESLFKLYDRIMQNLDRIPPGVSEPLVKPMDVDEVPIVVISLSASDYSDMQLKQLAQRLKEKLTTVAGVSVAGIIGGRDRTIKVHVDPVRMKAYEIALPMIENALRSTNVSLSGGFVVDNNEGSTVRVDGLLLSPKEIGRLVIAVAGGNPVYLEDVAEIEDGPEELDMTSRIGFGPSSEYSSTGDTRENIAVHLTLAKKSGTNAVVVANDILNRLDAIRSVLIPDDVTVTVSRNDGERANDAVNLLIEHLAIAITSVVFILLLFLGWREAAIVTMNIPLILFVVLAVGLLADQTINRITLFALILALGLLVDDAIVVIENIHRFMKKGVTDASEKARVIIRATNETGKPTIIATLAVILAFIPMAFVTGMMGPYMGPIPFNVPVAMLASLVIAYMFTPWIARRFLPISEGAHVSGDQENEATHYMGRLYSGLVTPLIESRSVQMVFFIVLGILMLFVLWQPTWPLIKPGGPGGVLTPGTVELKMLPKGNQNTFNITIDMKEGTPLEQTDRVARRIGDVLSAHPLITDYEAFVGMAGPVDFNGMLRGAVNKKGSHIAEIRVNLIDKTHRDDKSEEIVLQLRDSLKEVREAFPDANIKIVEDPPGPPVRSTLLAEIYGPDYEKSRKLAAAVRNEFENTWDVVDVDDSVGHAFREYRVDIDNEKAALAGISVAQVANLINGLVEGAEVGIAHIEGVRDPVRIRVRLPRKYRIDPSDAERIFITNNKGRQIPLAEIGSIIDTQISLPIYTKDGVPVVYVSAEPEQGSQVYATLDIDNRLDGKELVPGITPTTDGMRFFRSFVDDSTDYTILWDGEMRLTLDVFRDMGSAFIVAVILIYLLLYAYYGNIVIPLIVMGAIPLTLIGIFPGHLVMGQPFTATSMIGMIALAGIVVRNSLLLIDFILHYRQQGYPLKDAVIEAGAVRIRPILLTALAIIAGSSVMMADPVFGGLGVSMAYGTFASTLLTLFLIPLIYYLWQKGKET